MRNIVAFPIFFSFPYKLLKTLPKFNIPNNLNFMTGTNDLWRRLKGSLILPGLLVIFINLFMWAGGIFIYKSISANKVNKKDQVLRTTRNTPDKKFKAD